MKKITTTLLFILLSAFYVMMTPHLHIQANESNPITIRSSEMLTVLPNQPFSMGITMVDAKDIVGFQFEFFYNSDLFTVDAITTSTHLSADVIYNIDQPGVISVNYSYTAAPLNGTVPLFGITFSPVYYLVHDTYSVLSLNSDFNNLVSQIDEHANITPISNVFYTFHDVTVGQYGDINSDGSVDILDVGLLQLYLANRYTLTDAQKLVADVSGDDTVSLIDIAMIQLFVAEKIPFLGATTDINLPLPVFEGINYNVSFYIDAQNTYDPLLGVTAYDEIDGDLTAEIEVLGTYDLNTVGVYSILLRVTNSLGGRTTKTITLKVLESPVPDTLTTDPITITMWHAMGYSNVLLLQKYATSFMEKYPNITVVIAEGAGNYDTLRSNMINAITAGTYPNMVQGYPEHVSEYLNANVILNLDPYIQNQPWGLHGDDAFSDIIEAYRDENSQYDAEGTFYSLPFNKSTEVMIYNQDVFDRLNIDVPETWQDLITIAPLLKAEGERLAEEKVRAENPNDSEAQLAPKIASAKALIMPAAYDSNSNAFITFTKQFGGDYTSLNFETGRGQLLFNTSPNTLTAMQFLKDHKDLMTLPGYWGQSYSSVPFVNQQVFVTFGSSAGIRYSIPGGFGQGLGTTFSVGVAPMPYNADRPDDRAVIQQGTNISLLEKGTEQEQLASWLFLKHLITLENTMDWAINTGYLPVRTSAYMHPTYQAFLSDVNNPIALASKAAFDQSGYFFYDQAFVGSLRARIQVGYALERIIFGDGNIQEALDDAYNEANLGFW